MTLSIILVIELTSKKRRGLMIGLMNSGYTSGVSLGAVIAGALIDHTGWVRPPLYTWKCRSNILFSDLFSGFKLQCRF